MNRDERVVSTGILLRFDDICPTMKWRVWSEVETALLEKDIKPILAVVPDNRDPRLMIDPPAKGFWDRMRDCQARGWIPALHGYQHLYVTKDAGLVGRRKKSEFAGLPRDKQDEKLRLGIQILEREGIHPTVWIAPGHTFDTTTVALLENQGIHIISDGFFRYPFLSQGGMLWIPQQLSQIQAVLPGVWTVCHHINRWGTEDLENFCRALDKYRRRFVSLGQVVSQYGSRRGRLKNWNHNKLQLGYYLLRFELKLLAFL